jgi:hypothetical protein
MWVHRLAWQLETSPKVMICILEIGVETFGLHDILVTDLYNSIWHVGHAPVQTCNLFVWLVVDGWC